MVEVGSKILKETNEEVAETSIKLVNNSDEVIDVTSDVVKNTDEVADISNDISKNIDDTDDIIQDAVGAEKAIDNPNSNKKVVNGNDEFVDNSNKVNKPEKVAEEITEGTRNTYTGGRTSVELDDLARDPSHGFKIESQGLKERNIGLALEERGDLGSIIRDTRIDKGAEFIDETTGKSWDVKSFESYPFGRNGVPIINPKKGAFTVKTGMRKIQKELMNGHNVIIDTRNLVPEHIEDLMKAVSEAGISDKIIWYP